MKHRSFYNNLFDSILLLISNISLIVAYVLILLFGILNRENNYLILSIIITTIVFGFLIMLSLFLIILGCFEKISFDEKNIYSKKPFRKAIIISFDEILEVSEKEIPAVILGTGKVNALIIKSKEKSINIYLNKKITIEYIRNLLNNQNQS